MAALSAGGIGLHLAHHIYAGQPSPHHQPARVVVAEKTADVVGLAAAGDDGYLIGAGRTHYGNRVGVLGIDQKYVAYRVGECSAVRAPQRDVVAGRKLVQVVEDGAAAPCDMSGEHRVTTGPRLGRE